MQKKGKVASLAVAIDCGARAPSSCFPVQLLQVRDQAALHLRQGLQALFDNADDMLFEMADKASDRLEQNLHFEAMRDLRLKRKSIERGFLDALHEGFALLGQAAPQPFAAAIEPRNSAQLARTAALEAMVGRVLSRDGLALEHLQLRLQTSLGKPLAPRDNPLGPDRLCDCFLQVGRSQGVGPRVKLILLKLFERYVLHDLDRLYDHANLLLGTAGVLSELKPIPRRRADDHRHAARPRSAGLATDEAAQCDGTGQAFFDSLEGWLAPIRGRIAPRVQHLASAQPISTADLLRLLSHLQHYVPAIGEADDFDLGQQLEQLLLRVSVRSGTRRRIATADEDTLNLVRMLFDFIQADHNLSPTLRALIGRLHIPLLKVALLDKSLFNCASHPARRLLNEMATAASGWETGTEGLRDSLHLHVERIVQRLLNDFTDDTRLFNDLLEDFLAFNQEKRRGSELLEQCTRDAEQGRVRALQARQSGPQAVVRMLVKALRQGEVRLLDDGLLFECALEAVLEHLRCRHTP